MLRAALLAGLLVASPALAQGPSSAAPPAALMTIGRLHYDGGGDWYANPSSLPNLLGAIRTRTGLQVSSRETVVTLAEALWRTVLEQPASHQLLTELSMFALRTPHLKEALQSHYSEVLAATTKLVDQAAERTGHQLGQPAETIARFFLAGFDGLTMQHLSLPDEEAERVCLRALISAVLAMA